MKRINQCLLVIALGGTVCATALARNTELHFPLADVINMPEAKEKLDGSVQFYLAGQATPKITEHLSSDVSNRKTNGFGKSDEKACKWAALSALIAFQEKAKSLGANAVVDMVSYYKKNESKSATDYECHAGAFITGVTLKGTFAKTTP